MRESKAVKHVAWICITLLSLKDARYDSEIIIMWLGKIERMRIQSRVGEKWIAGGKKRERERENEHG